MVFVVSCERCVLVTFAITVFEDCISCGGTIRKLCEKELLQVRGNNQLIEVKL